VNELRGGLYLGKHLLQHCPVIGLETLWDDLADIIKNDDCQKFIARLVETAQEQTGKQAHAFTVEGMLAELAKHPNNGTNGINLYLTGGKVLYGYGGWNKVTGKGGVDLGDQLVIGPIDEQGIRAAHRNLARDFLHEIIHTATKFGTAIQATGGYSDVELATAIFAITKDWHDDPDDPRNNPPGSHPTTVGGMIYRRALENNCK
jgi:hypothetical protein